MIELHTLGRLQLRDDRGRDLCEALQPKRLALLAYLAHPPHRFHRRDLLLALFWPELDPRGARNSLRQALFSLRQALGEGVLRGRGNEEIGIATGKVWSDVAALDAALVENRPKEAVRLYGGNFLEGFHAYKVAPEFEHWLEVERFRFREKMVQVALDLATDEQAAGNPASAVHWAREASRLDPDDEKILRFLIDLLAQQGDLPRATREYESFRQRVREEYDVAPAPETRALVEDLQHQSELAETDGVLTSEIVAPPTRFIGREQELVALEEIVLNPNTRIATLTGPGGCGKTRLSLELVRRIHDRFRDGVSLVNLNGVSKPAQVLTAVARQLDLHEDGRRTLLDSLLAYLACRQMLLVLDGFEQVRSAGRELVGLLREAPNLTIIVTTRIPLRVSGEREFVVPPLTLPRPGLSATTSFPLNSEAVELFFDRAEALRADFRLTSGNLAAVAEICRQLDGLPLAIELAAARIKTLTPDAISQRLTDRFALLTGGPSDRPSRQRSLEATLAWSCDLLAADERLLFSRLGMFAGGFSLDTGEWVLEGSEMSAIDLIEVLAALIDHNLLTQREIAGEPRFEMLATVQAYAQKLLAESGEECTWRTRHADQLLCWIEDGEQYYCTSEQDSWFRRLEGEHDNIKSALRWSLSQDRSDIGLRICAALWPFWWAQGQLTEAQEWLSKTLAFTNSGSQSPRAKALLGASWIASAAAEHMQAAKHAKESLELYGRLGEEANCVRALEAFGFIQLEAGNITDAESAFRKCLLKSRKAGDSRRELISLDALGQVALARDDINGAEDLFKQSVKLALMSDQGSSVAHGLLCLGDIARRKGRLEEALISCERALEIYRELGQKINIAWALCYLGRASLELDHGTAAQASYSEALAIFEELRYGRGIGRAMTGLVGVSVAREEFEHAARLLGGIETFREGLGDVFPPEDESLLEDLSSRLQQHLREPLFTHRLAEGRALDMKALSLLARGIEPTIAHRAAG